MTHKSVSADTGAKVYFYNSLVYVVGQTAWDPTTSTLMTGSIENQVTQILSHLEHTLHNADSGRDCILSMNVFCALRTIKTPVREALTALLPCQPAIHYHSTSRSAKAPLVIDCIAHSNQDAELIQRFLSHPLFATRL